MKKCLGFASIGNVRNLILQPSVMPRERYLRCTTFWQRYLRSTIPS